MVVQHQVAQLTLKMGSPPLLYSCPSKCGTALIVAGPAQRGQDGAKLHLFSLGSSSLCVKIHGPRVWCLLRVLCTWREAALCVRNEKVEFYQRLGSGTGMQLAHHHLSGRNCESCLLRWAPRIGLSPGNLGSYLIVAKQGVLRDKCFKRSARELCLNHG